MSPFPSSAATVAAASSPSLQAAVAFRQQLFQQPWLKELMDDLYRRQAKSLERVAALRDVSVNNAVLWPFHAPPVPICVEEARGGRLWDVDGNEYVDLFMGFGTQTLHGHNPEPVVDFVRKHLGRSVGPGVFSTIELELANLLRELMPHNEKFAFLNSGTDATQGAIRLARGFSGKRLVVRFEGSVQGSHDLGVHNTMSIFHGYPLVPYPPQDGDGVKLSPYALGAAQLSNQDLLILHQNDPAALEIIQRRKDEIACVIVEPVQANFPFPEKTIPYKRQLSEVCQKAGVLFILDEVHSGFRHGISGAAGHYGLRADLITYGKVLSGLGIPLSAIAGRGDILDLALTSGQPLTDWGRKTFISTTHAGNHLALLASYASLRLLKEKGPAFYERTREKVARVRARLAKLQQQGIPLHLIGYGDFVGLLAFLDPSVPLDSSRDLNRAMNPMGAAIFTLLLRRLGVHAFNAPFFFTGDCHSSEEMDLIIDRIEAAVMEMKRNDFPFILPR